MLLLERSHGPEVVHHFQLQEKEQIEFVFGQEFLVVLNELVDSGKGAFVGRDRLRDEQRLGLEVVFLDLMPELLENLLHILLRYIAGGKLESLDEESCKKVEHFGDGEGVEAPLL